jgi:hypothetical protein
MADSKKGVPVTAEGNEDAGMVPMGDHTTADLAGTYRDNPDKPDPSTIAQVQDVPEGWPGTGQA